MDYQLFLCQLKELIKNEPNTIANLANTSAFLNDLLTDINWVGFYLLDENNELVLGPFQGKVACVRIPVGKGVCGCAVERGKTIVVDNVHQFEGHIACDSQSRSEIVIPLIHQNTCIGVLDIDSPIYNRFDAQLSEFLEEVAHIISNEAF